MTKAALVLFCAMSLTADAGVPPSAPVTITYSPRPAARPNEDVTTTISFKADADLQTLEVAVQAGDGLVISSPAREAVFNQLETGDVRTLAVTVRLTDPRAGTITVFVKATSDTGETMLKNMSLLIGTPAPKPATVIDSDQNLSDLTLVNSGGDKAAVRFGRRPLRVVGVGDRLGRTSAEVKAVAADRLVIEETVVAPDGTTTRFEIVLRKGETGGTRTPLQRE
jgi:hypothetical protein